MDVLKKFAAYYKPYKKFFFLDLFCATIISAVDLAFPQILRRAASDWFTGARKPSCAPSPSSLQAFWSFM